MGPRKGIIRVDMKPTKKKGIDLIPDVPERYLKAIAKEVAARPLKPGQYIDLSTEGPENGDYFLELVRQSRAPKSKPAKK